MRMDYIASIIIVLFPRDNEAKDCQSFTDRASDGEDYLGVFLKSPDQFQDERRRCQHAPASPMDGRTH
jgi:hypothetical protein